MFNHKISDLDAYLICKNSSINELLEYIVNSNAELRCEAARKFQFFPFYETQNIIQNVLLTSQYSRHRETAAYILGQIQQKLNEYEVMKIIHILIKLIQNDKSVNVKSSAIFSLGHLFRIYGLGEKEFRLIEKNITHIWKFDNYSIIMALVFSAAYFPKRNYIKKYLISHLNHRHSKIILWTLFSLKEKQYKSKLIEPCLIKKLNYLPENNYLYSEIIAFLIFINSKQVIPYLESILKKNKIDNEIYIELENSKSKHFKYLKEYMLEKYK